MRLKLIACEILFRELSAAAARSPNRVDLQFLSKGLHDVGQAGMLARLSEAIEAVDESDYDALVLGYALCSNGIVGLRARSKPLVVARAHDCITLFLGDRRRYLDYFTQHPGFYFKTSGWIERGAQLVPLSGDTVSGGLTEIPNYEALVAKYGEDNARFLYEQLGDLTRNYSGLAYIAMGVGPDEQLARETRALAERRGWRYEHVQGDMALLQGLVDGPWDDSRYLVVPPGRRIVPSYDEKIIEAQADEEKETPP